MESHRFITILTPEEAAEYLDISRLTLRNWMTKNKRTKKHVSSIPHIKIGNTIRFVKEKLEQWKYQN